MPENILLPYAKTLTSAELPWDTSCLLAKCNFSYDHSAQKYCIRLPRAHSLLSMAEITGLDADNRICGKLTAVLVPLKKQPLSETTRPSGPVYWKTFSKEEIIEFSQLTNDRNPIHFQEHPIVQGLLIFSQLLQMTNETHAAIRFLSPLYADEKVWLLQEKNALIGFSQKRSCFNFARTNIHNRVLSGEDSVKCL